jgi:hypothetical protein
MTHVEQLLRRPSSVRDFLRERRAETLTAEVKQERQAPPPCRWCAQVALGNTEVATLSAPQCPEHKSLNQEYGRRLRSTPIGEEWRDEGLREEIAARGVEIASVKRWEYEPPGAA